jgi:hypothetical protein
MKTTLRLFFSAMTGILFAGVASAADPAAKTNTWVEVIFLHPENFTDVRDAFGASEMGREGILTQLRDYLVHQTMSCVPDGQKLTITFTDIDLAGDYEPWHGAEAMDVRVVKEIYPPKMDLEFKLTGADGKVLKEGKRQLRDLIFMAKPYINRDDALHFEKTLLEDWLHKEFPPVKSG